MPVRKPLLVVALACTIAAGVLTPGPASSQTPPVDGDIAFATGRGGELFEIWAVDANGTAPRRLIAGPPGSVEVDPAFDPTAGSLAFARKATDDETYDLMVGSSTPPVNAIKLTDENGGAANDRQPNWSDTGEIAFTRSLRAQDTTHIYKVAAAGGTPVPLTGTPAPGYDASPAWSPGGSELAFVSDRTGFPQIFRMDAGGVTETQVTFETACFVANPVWAGATDLVFEKLCLGSPTGSDIYALDLTTGVQTPVVTEAGHDHQPALAPAGGDVVFVRVEPDGDKDLRTAQYPGPGPSSNLIGNAPEADLAPDWGVDTTGRGTSPPNAAPSGVGAVGSDARESAEGRTVHRPGGNSGGGQEVPRTIARGVRFRQMRRAGSDVYVLKVSPPLRPRLDVSLSNDLLPGHERTSSMARRHRAVAAINGDFGTPSGRPSHTFAEDGDLKQVSFAVAPTFAMRQDETQTFLDRPVESALAIEQDSWLVDRWNFGQPGFLDVSAFTPVGGALEVPPPNACSARLVPSSGRRWAPGLQGVETDYVVNEVGCSVTPMAVNGGIVLSARPGSDGAILLESLTSGEGITLRWSVGFPGVLDTVGGIPLLVENGAVVATQCPESICRRHPRTGIGVTPTGRILMVVVDGRRNDSKGMTLVRFARLMQELHASFALNLDGGGSSTMWVDPRGRRLRGRVVNEPSDGRQRKVSSAVLVIKGADPGEAVSAPVGRLPAGPAPAPAVDQAGERAVADPASTGGLLEAMVEGTFGPPVALSPSLRRALREFRSRR